MIHNYLNFPVLLNATCIKSIGLFTVFKEKQNYCESIKRCQSIGGDLPDVTSRVSTKYLSQIINSSLDVWYKVAYVGLDDYEYHKQFVSVNGKPLSCVRYRAWAPGHPRLESAGNNCVVLDTEKMWRVVGCHRKLPAVCQLFPDASSREINLSDFNCENLSNKCKQSSLFKYSQY